MILNEILKNFTISQLNKTDSLKAVLPVVGKLPGMVLAFNFVPI